MHRKLQRKHIANQNNSLIYRSEGKERIPFAFISVTAFYYIMSQCFKVLGSTYDRIYPDSPMFYPSLFYFIPIIVASCGWILFYNLNYIICELMALINDDKKSERIQKAELKYRKFAYQFRLHICVVTLTFSTIMMIYSDSTLIESLLIFIFSMVLITYALLKDSKKLLQDLWESINLDTYFFMNVFLYVIAWIALCAIAENSMFEKNIYSYDVNYIGGETPYMTIQYYLPLEEDGIAINIENDKKTTLLDMDDYDAIYTGQQEMHKVEGSSDKNLNKGLDHYINLKNYKHSYNIRVPLKADIATGNNEIDIEFKTEKATIKLTNVLYWDGVNGTFIEKEFSSMNK